MNQFDVKVMKSLQDQDDLHVGHEEYREPDATEMQKGQYGKSDKNNLIRITENVFTLSLDTHHSNYVT